MYLLPQVLSLILIRSKTGSKVDIFLGFAPTSNGTSLSAPADPSKQIEWRNQKCQTVGAHHARVSPSGVRQAQVPQALGRGYWRLRLQVSSP